MNIMDQPIVDIEEGKLKGLLGRNLEGETIFTFLGIPYAKPPVGKLRFRDAQPAEPWNGIKESINEGEVSLQAGSASGIITGSENCLTLNVFTKKLPKMESKLFPVMVWIHAGGFKTGSKTINDYGPEYLLLEDVVIVCINYRLGILGFLCLQDSSLGIPGNGGIKDQVLALKWVQRNIKYFGGDAGNITVFGNSVGGSSVELLLQSPLTDGLFHKAIMQSGSMLNPWIFGDFKILDFMESFGKKCNSEKEALDILMKMPAEELCKNQIKYCELSGRPFGLGAIGVVVEPPSNTALITKTAIELLKTEKKRNIPIMLGYAANEGLLFKACGVFERYAEKAIPDERFFDIFVPTQLKDPLLRKEVCKKLRSFYFKEESTFNKYEMAGDAWFIIGILASAKQYMKSNENVYLYRVSLDAGLNGFKIKMGMDVPGTCHGDDVGYLFKQNIPNLKICEPEIASVRKMVKLWTNFAKYGNPTLNENDVLWTPTDDDLSFLDINQELVMKSNPKEEALQLWNDIYEIGGLNKIIF